MNGGEGHGWGNGLLQTFLLVHLQYFAQFIRGKGASEELEKAKGTPPTCLPSNNFFDDGIKWKNGSDPKQKKERVRDCGCSKRFISRHVLREGIRHSLEGPRDELEALPKLESPKEQQTPTSVYNYQLHPFLWDDEIRSLGQGIIF